MDKENAEVMISESISFFCNNLQTTDDKYLGVTHKGDNDKGTNVKF